MNTESPEPNYHIAVFTAPWCTACKPEKQRILDAGLEGVEVEVIDISTGKGGEAAACVGVSSLPTVVVHVRGHRVLKSSGKGAAGLALETVRYYRDLDKR